jgi:hypothetical protein
LLICFSRFVFTHFPFLFILLPVLFRYLNHIFFSRDVSEIVTRSWRQHFHCRYKVLAGLL